MLADVWASALTTEATAARRQAASSNRMRASGHMIYIHTHTPYTTDRVMYERSCIGMNVCVCVCVGCVQERMAVCISIVYTAVNWTA